MKITIRGHALELTDDDRELIERRLRFALGRFEGAVRTVKVRLRDVNGPRGGQDKRCGVELRGDGLGTLRVEAAADTALAAAARAAEVAGRALARALERRSWQGARGPGGEPPAAPRGSAPPADARGAADLHPGPPAPAPGA